MNFPQAWGGQCGCSGGCGPSTPWIHPVPQPLWLTSPLLHLMPKPCQDQLRGLDQAVLWE